MPNSRSMTQATMGKVQIPVSKLLGRCRECRRAVSAALASAPMAGSSDVLRAARARQKLGSVLTTQRPSNVEARVDGPTPRWCGLPSSTLLLAIAWQLGRLRHAQPVCANGSTVCRSSGVSTGLAEPLPTDKLGYLHQLRPATALESGDSGRLLHPVSKKGTPQAPD
jgi:hypothetical protein